MKQLHKIPACAWKRTLGDIPYKCSSTSPKRGVALGGFGAGSFMYNIAGTFGPWQTLDNTLYKNHYLDSASFLVYEKKGNDKPFSTSLSSDWCIKRDWPKLSLKDADYYALQPMGWVNYKCFKSQISLNFWSPVIPKNYKETSYPTSIWDFKIYNPTSEKIDISIMFTFPGIYIGAHVIDNKFINIYKKNKDVEGVVLKSENYKGSWCIATESKSDREISYVTSWNAKSTGYDIWNIFSKNGDLNNTAIDKSYTGGAINVKTMLVPKQTKNITFCLSWDFPIVTFGAGTEWWKKYVEYFSKTGNNSFKIAVESLKKKKQWHKKVMEWMNPIINNSKYPDWLKSASLNELYYSQFGGIFYSSALKSNQPKNKKKLQRFKHLFYEMECEGYPFANTLDVRHYSSLPYVKFWPKIEKELLMLFSDEIKDTDNEKHLVPHDAGNPAVDPIIRVHDYFINRLEWKDLPAKFILQVWRYYYLYKDRTFLKYVWQSCKYSYEFLKSTDKNKDYIPDNYGSDNTYDVWGLYGTSLLCGGLWIAALYAMDKMSEILHDGVNTEIKKILKFARRNLDKQLWIPEKGYYRIDTDSKYPDAIMSDGLNGERYCHVYGLPSILPKKKMKSHLKNVYEKCVKPFKNRKNDYKGIGAVNGVKTNGSLLHIHQSDEIWTGSTYFLAAIMYQYGLKKEALDTAYGIAYNCYYNDKSAYWFNTPEAWNKNAECPRPVYPEQYQRPRAIWELLMEIEDPY